jgi:hypothetical protein
MIIPFLINCISMHYVVFIPGRETGKPRAAGLFALYWMACDVRPQHQAARVRNHSPDLSMVRKSAPDFNCDIHQRNLQNSTISPAPRPWFPVR